MLSTGDAFLYAFSEIRNRPQFWIFTALLYVLLGSIRDAFPKDAILEIAILISETFLNITVAIAALKGIGNKEYNLVDIFPKPKIFLKAFLLYTLIGALGGIVLVVPTLLIFLSLSFKGLSTTLISSLILVIMFLILLLMFVKLFFAQYYLLDKQTTIWQTLKESWKDCNFKVVLSIIIAIVWMVSLSVPLYALDKILSKFYLHSTHIAVPIGIIACAHMYMQLQNRKTKEIVEQEKIVQQDSGTYEV